MTPSKWLLSLLALLLLGGAGFFLFFRGSETPPADTSLSALQSPAPAAAPAPSPFPSAPPMKRVMDLYEAESKRIGQVDPDPALTEKRLRAAAKELNPDEVAWLGDQALDPENSMDARFFATYLAALGSSEAGVATLRRIALSPVPPSKNERRVEEERVLRMQAVEGLGRSCALTSAKDSLLDVVSAADEIVRDRAHRALYACQTGKRIEDADKAAIQKLQQQNGAK